MQHEAPSLLHVAIIMDGNGRWAKARHLPRTAGHKQGAEAVKSIVKACIESDIPYLTLYAFSSENWKRPTDEVFDLMELLRFYLKREIQNLHKENVRIRVIGDKSRLDPDIREQIHLCEEKTRENQALCLTIALSYGSRQEITQAVRQLVQHCIETKCSPDIISENLLSDYLYTAGIPDPDLLIRTGGEQRLSNFLLWQSAYTELWFTSTLWPDFSPHELKEAMADFYQRERRYGTA